MPISSFRNSFAPAFLFVTAISLLLSCAQSPKPGDIWNVWTGEAAGERLAFEFKPDGNCILTFINIERGDTNMLHGRYVMDFTKRPVPISIRKIDELSHALHAIVDFQSDGSIRLSQFSTQWRLRPVAFEPEKTVILHRASVKQ